MQKPSKTGQAKVSNAGLVSGTLWWCYTLHAVSLKHSFFTTQTIAFRLSKTKVQLLTKITIKRELNRIITGTHTHILLKPQGSLPPTIRHKAP